MEATARTRSATIEFGEGFSLYLNYQVGRQFKPHERDILKCAIKAMLLEINETATARTDGDANVTTDAIELDERLIAGESGDTNPCELVEPIGKDTRRSPSTRNVSIEERERRRQRMKDYWSKKRGEAADA